MRSLLVLFIGMCLPLAVLSQAVNLDNPLKYSDILPPSPAVASISNFSRPGVGMISGTAQFNVPIASANFGSLSLPIGVNYSSNGIKVDEIASRVGMGFQFEGGGVITRTVRGTGPDELTLHKLPSSWSTATREMVDYLKALTTSPGASGSYDSELDMFDFSFAGQSGQFVLDDEGGSTNANTVRQVSKSNLKIERDFSSSDYTFKITDAGGNTYYFGGTGFIETSKKSSTCGKSYQSQYHPTAWFLRKIILYNGELINFSYLGVSYTYDLGVNQSQNYQAPINPDPSRCTCPAVAVAINTCVNFIAVNTLMLSNISGRGTTVNFDYQSRSDCGDKLLKKITLSSPSGDYKQIYLLEYDQIYTDAYMSALVVLNGITSYRPFLKNINRLSTDESKSILLYEFSYNDAESLPVRLSFAQDHWGYFNGKSNANLLTLPTNYNKAEFPGANADREPREAHSGKGMLSRISYPTGGFDQIIYEPNSNYETQIVYPTEDATNNYTISRTTGSPHGYEENVVGIPLTIGFTQTVTILLTSVKDSGGSTPDDRGGVRFERSTATGGGSYLNIDTPTGQENYVTGVLPAGDYKVFVRAFGFNTTTTTRFTYIPGLPENITKNWIKGGNRVKSIQSYSAEGETSQVRRFKYGTVDYPDRSMGITSYTPSYLTPKTYDFQCTVALDHGMKCEDVFCSFNSLFSTSFNNLFTANGSAIAYPSVLEIIEDEQGTTNTGMIEHKFHVVNDDYGSMIYGERPPGMPQTNWSVLLNGKEKETIYYKRKESWNNNQLSVTYEKVKRIANLFSTRPSDIGYLDEVTVNKLFEPCTHLSGPYSGPDELNPYEVYRYSIIMPWMVLESTVEEIYEPNIALPLSTTTTYSYDDPVSMLPTQITTLNSQGKSEVTNNFYSSMSESQPVETRASLDILAAKNNFSLIARTGLVGNLYTSGYQVTYDTNDPVLLPKTVKEFGKDQQQVSTFTILERDNVGNVIERENQAGIRESYVWDNWKFAPIAKIVGARIKNSAYSNFELDNGNWGTPTNGSRAIDLTSPFGTSCLKLNAGTISYSNVDNTLRYVVSYWAKTGSSISVESTVISHPAVEGQNGWSFFQHVVSGTNIISVGGTGSIDDLRAYPMGAQMFTFVYDAAGKRLRKAADNNGVITSYEYDDFDRLIAIKDHRNNLLKTFKYHFREH